MLHLVQSVWWILKDFNYSDTIFQTIDSTLIFTEASVKNLSLNRGSKSISIFSFLLFSKFENLSSDDFI